MNFVPKAILSILTEHLDLRSYKKYTRNLLDTRLRHLQHERSKKLLRVYSKNFVIDEKNVATEQKFNKQNNEVYAPTSYEAKAKVPGIKRNQRSFSMMVWWGVLWNGAIAIHFCTPGVKTTAKIYEETVHKPIVKPLNDTLFKGQCRIFQQDSA